jgi:hypothetical protein
MKHLHTYESFLNEALAKPDQYYVVAYIKNANSKPSIAQEDFASKDEADAFAQTQTLQKNTYAYVFELPKDKKIFEEYLAVLPFKTVYKTDYVGHGISMGVDLFNKSSLEEQLEYTIQYLKEVAASGKYAGFGWKADLSAIKSGRAAIERWISVVDQLPPSELNRSNDNYSPDGSIVFKAPTPTGPEAIIGSPVKLGGLEIAENDFSNVIMTWDNAIEACAELGRGWRLPTLAELDLMYKNKDKIGGFKKDRYWSSEAAEFGSAMIQDFTSGEQVSDSKKNPTNLARAVKG